MSFTAIRQISAYCITLTCILCLAAPARAQVLEQDSLALVTLYDDAGSATIKVATATGDPLGVSGMRVIAEVTFTSDKVGFIDIGFVTASKLRDSDNVDILLSETVQTMVEVR